MVEQPLLRRENLLQAVERDREELRRALTDLRDLTQQRWNLAERITSQPGKWLVGALLVGMAIGMQSE